MPRTKGQNAITPELLEKEAEVVKLRRGGMTWDMIAKQMGYANPSGAHTAYVRACNRIVYEDVTLARQTEIDRLDIAQSRIWNGVLKGDHASITVMVKLIQERAKLLGLYSPVKMEANVTMWEGDETIDRAVKDLAELLRFNSEGSASPRELGEETSEDDSTLP